VCGIKKTGQCMDTEDEGGEGNNILFVCINKIINHQCTYNAKKLIRIRSSIHYSTYLPNRKNNVTKL